MCPSKVMGHRPRKRFGQNFLHDQAVINTILRAIAPKPEDFIVEIGPGLGALTKPLMAKLNALTAIEIDRDLQAGLSVFPKLNLIDADALKVNYAELGSQLRLVGNLPYNISTPLILHLLQFSNTIIDMHFMLQKEVVTRLAAQPGHKSFGRLSVMVQYFCEVEHLFDVPPSAFDPAPKVDSAIVRLIPYRQRPYKEVNIKNLEALVARAFSMRRKTLANNLKPILQAKEIEALGIDPTRRPEQLSINDFVSLANLICNNQ